MFDDMVVDMEANKKLNPVVIELFLSEKESTFCLNHHNHISKC